MDQTSEKALLEYLSDLGFKGSQLEKDLQRQMALRLPAFQVKHQVDYGDERMFFELYFRRDHQFNSYRLEKYKATHRDAIIITHDIINGVDTRYLEEQMGWPDWKKVLTGDKRFAPVEETLEMLYMLTEGQNFDGIQIQQALMYKYFPFDLYVDPSKNDMRDFYENSREFLSSDAGICNVHLAFHLLSGRFDDINEKLSNCNPGKLFMKDLDPILMDKLSTNPMVFSLELYQFCPDGYRHFKMPVVTEQNWFVINTYTLSYKPFPEIPAGLFNGVNAIELDERMSKINWVADKDLVILSEDWAPSLQPRANDIFNQLILLGNDKEGQIIAEILQLKYWANSALMEPWIFPPAWETLNRLPTRSYTFGAETPASAGLNLLQGRPVAERVIFPELRNSKSFVQLLPVDLPERIRFNLVQVPAFEVDALRSQLRMLPMDSLNQFIAVEALQIGETAQVSLNNGKAIILEVDPINNSLLIYDNHHRFIPTNFHFDPDWKPPGLKAPNQAPEHKKGRQHRDNKLKFKKGG